MDALSLLSEIFDGYRHVPRDGRGRRSVGPSEDLDRILGLPMKPAGGGPDFTESLRRRGADPNLVINDAQNDALWNAQTARGLLGFMSPGAGKSGTALLLPTVMDVKSAVILTRSTLRGQMLADDVPMWVNNFDVRMDRIRFVTFEELSDADTADELDRAPPELLIVDEAHRIANPGSARHRRLARFHREHPDTRGVFMSGSLTAKSIKDYSFFAEWALGKGSPLPLHWPELQAWSKALDPVDGSQRWGAGALERLVEWAGGDCSLLVAFQRRLKATWGVTISAALDASLPPLYMHERHPTGNMTAIRQHLTVLRETETRPDGEVMEESFAQHRAGRQMAFGFYLRWLKERIPAELWREWFDCRGAWHRAVRQQLKRAAVEGMDSPMLLANAADRMICVRFGCAKHHKETKDAVGCSACGGPLQPQWPCPEWGYWKAVKDKVKVESEAVWFSDVMVEDAVLWGQQYTGIIWYRSPALGERVAARGGFPLFGDGRKASDGIRDENRRAQRRTIVASIFCHGEGKNLPSWHNHLVLDPPSNGKEWEQLLARPHRRGQKHPRVDFWVYRHTKELCAAFDTAMLHSRFVEEGHGMEQRLLKTQKSFAYGQHADRALLEVMVTREEDA